MAVPFAEMGGVERNPGLKLRSSEARRRAYVRCAATAYASFRRWEPDFDLAFVTNVPERYNGGDFAALGVALVDAPFEHQTKAGAKTAFRTSLFMVDALIALLARPEWDVLYL